MTDGSPVYIIGIINYESILWTDPSTMTPWHHDHVFLVVLSFCGVVVWWCGGVLSVDGDDVEGKYKYIVLFRIQNKLLYSQYWRTVDLSFVY